MSSANVPPGDGVLAVDGLNMLRISDVFDGPRGHLDLETRSANAWGTTSTDDHGGALRRLGELNLLQINRCFEKNDTCFTIDLGGQACLSELGDSVADMGSTRPALPVVRLLPATSDRGATPLNRLAASRCEMTYPRSVQSLNTGHRCARFRRPRAHPRPRAGGNRGARPRASIPAIGNLRGDMR